MCARDGGGSELVILREEVEIQGELPRNQWLPRRRKHGVLDAVTGKRTGGGEEVRGEAAL